MTDPNAEPAQAPLTALLKKTFTEHGRGWLAIRYDQLTKWAADQPEGSIVGYAAKPTDCPCNRCMIDLGIATLPEGTVLRVLVARAIIQREDAPNSTSFNLDHAWLPKWLDETIDAIDQYGMKRLDARAPEGVPVTREALLAILTSKRVVRHVPLIERVEAAL